ncbi:hypothetical protein Tco_0011579 [Tanacetum coccineum]
MKPLRDLVGQDHTKEGREEEQALIAVRAAARDRIEYVDASPPDVEIVSLEVVEIVDPEVERIDDDNLFNNQRLYLHISDLFLEEANTFDNSIPESETFRFNLEEISSGSPTTHSDLSLPDYKAFYVDNDHFKERSSGNTTTHIEPELGNLTMDVVNDIFPTREPRVHVPNVLPTHLTLDTDFILLSEPLFALVCMDFSFHFSRIPVAPPYLLSTRNEDTIFDPGISMYHSFMPDVSHRSGTFMKFNVYPNHLNESPMEILSSTCSPMDQ